MRSKNLIYLIILSVILSGFYGCAILKGKGYESQATRYFSEQDFIKAAEYYNKAVEFDSDNTGYLTQLGWSYFKIGNLDAAISIFEKIEEINPNVIEAYTGRGWSYFKKLDFPNL